MKDFLHKRAAIVSAFILFAIPIPFSLISWIGIIMAVAAIGSADWSRIDGIVQGALALATMLLAGTYPGSYLAALLATISKKRLNKYSFLPVCHVALFLILAFLWNYSNEVFL